MSKLARITFQKFQTRGCKEKPAGHGIDLMVSILGVKLYDTLVLNTEQEAETQARETAKCSHCGSGYFGNHTAILGPAPYLISRRSEQPEGSGRTIDG